MGRWWCVLAACLAGAWYLAGCRIGFDPRVTADAADPADARDPVVDAGPCAGYAAWPGFTSTYRADDAGALDWAVAEATCEAEGAHLVVVDDAAEHAEVRARATGVVWIGLSDRITEGTFLHVTGAALAYHGWPGAPQSNTGEDCVELLLDGPYEDTACVQNVPNAYVCECDGVPAQPSAF